MTFFGVRGSTPCSSDLLRRYGGNTSCVVVTSDDAGPIVLDMGTGLREFGTACGTGTPIDATILVSHLHWDHVQGLPFFSPIHHPESTVTIYGPPHDGRSLRDCFDVLMAPPYFPIGCDHLPTGINFVTKWDEVFDVDGATVTTRSVPLSLIHI